MPFICIDWQFIEGFEPISRLSAGNNTRSNFGGVQSKKHEKKSMRDCRRVLKEVPRKRNIDFNFVLEPHCIVNCELHSLNGWQVWRFLHLLVERGIKSWRSPCGFSPKNEYSNCFIWKFIRYSEIAAHGVFCWLSPGTFSDFLLVPSPPLMHYNSISFNGQFHSVESRLHCENNVGSSSKFCCWRIKRPYNSHSKHRVSMSARLRFA